MILFLRKKGGMREGHYSKKNATGRTIKHHDTQVTKWGSWILPAERARPFHCCAPTTQDLIKIKLENLLGHTKDRHGLETVL